MSISLLPGVVKIGRSKCPTQRALHLQESSPSWVFPQVVWVRRGPDEKSVHGALRPYRIDDAPSREYFRLPIKAGADLEQILYAVSSDESESSHDNGGVQDQDSGVQENLGGAPRIEGGDVCACARDYSARFRMFKPMVTLSIYSW
ncbi:MAG: GIY-YIG nuclease family protein [Porticoccaceae bacterium]